MGDGERGTLSRSIDDHRQILGPYTETGVTLPASAVQILVATMAAQVEMARTLEQQNAELIELNGMAGWLDGRLQ